MVFFVIVVSGLPELSVYAINLPKTLVFFFNNYLTYATVNNHGRTRCWQTHFVLKAVQGCSYQEGEQNRAVYCGE